MNILLLEDNPNRIRFFKNSTKQHHLHICRHAKAAKKLLRKHDFDLIFLDHDLRGKPEDPISDNCGSEVARFIVKNEITCKQIILHSENAIGRESMENILPESQSIPYSRLKKIGFRNILKSLEIG